MIMMIMIMIIMIMIILLGLSGPFPLIIPEKVRKTTIILFAEIVKTKKKPEKSAIAPLRQALVTQRQGFAEDEKPIDE